MVVAISADRLFTNSRVADSRQPGRPAGCDDLLIRCFKQNSVKVTLISGRGQPRVAIFIPSSSPGPLSACRAPLPLVNGVVLITCRIMVCRTK